MLLRTPDTTKNSWETLGLGVFLSYMQPTIKNMSQTYGEHTVSECERMNHTSVSAPAHWKKKETCIAN